jgi:hypothetical protein
VKLFAFILFGRAPAEAAEEGEAKALPKKNPLYPDAHHGRSEVEPIADRHHDRTWSRTLAATLM